MRIFIALVAAVLLYVPSFAGGIVVDQGQVNFQKSLYAVDLKLYAGDKTTQETAVTFFEGYPASMITYTKRGTEGVPGVEVVENLRVLILAGTTGCEFTKPDAFTDRLWDGFWLAAQHLTIGDLDFYVYSPVSDRIVISVDKFAGVQEETGQVLDIRGLDDLEKVSRNRLLNENSFYGSLEMPYHCDEIGKPLYIFTLKGSCDGELIRETQVPFNAGSEIRLSQLCRSEDEGEGAERGYPSCLMMVVNKETTDADLEEKILTALDGYLPPPISTVVLGQLSINYYFPRCSEVEITIWEIEGELDDKWETHSKLVGRTRVANNQPDPSAL